MLQQVAEGVWVHQSPLLQNNTVVVQGSEGVLLVDPGITGDELACLASDLRELGQPVVAGFSTHPDWDHSLWFAEFGDAPRYATARGAGFMREFLAQDDWHDLLAEGLPPEIADEIPLEGFGQLTALPPDAVELPWNGPTARVIEHPAHAVGHAALLIEDRGVLIAGDMLSDILIPFLALDAADPVDDYLAGLDALEGVADAVEVVVPGHGSPGDDVRARIDLDRAYTGALRSGGGADDPRIGPDATYGQDWLPDVHGWQAQQVRRD
jgi:glyoxylase-like metal-dependent hydrolase (beta-lactamase superfamily II)